MTCQDGQDENSLSEYHMLTSHLLAFSQALFNFLYQHANLFDIFYLLILEIVTFQKPALFPGICIMLQNSGIRFPTALVPSQLPGITTVVFVMEALRTDLQPAVVPWGCT